MKIDTPSLAVQLLERIANSVHDRDPKNPNPAFFTLAEVKVVEEWLKELAEIISN